MGIDLELISQVGAYSFKNEHELLKSIKELSHLFNHSRDKLADYLDDEKLCSAYLYFYFMTYLPKFQKCIELLGPNFRTQIQGSALIDIGAGPGTLFHSQNWPGFSLYAVENSKVMIDIGKKLAHITSLNIQWNKQVQEEKRCLFFTHSLNEMGEKEAFEYMEAYSPQNVVLIEPGTKESFHKILGFRKQILERGYNVQYPCPSNDVCPMQGQDDWCHQIIQVRQLPEIERLCQKLQMDRRNQPAVLHWYSREKKQIQYALITRVFAETKFSFEWQVCCENKLQKVQLMKKELDKKQQKLIKSWQAGQQIQFEVLKHMQGFLRITLI